MLPVEYRLFSRCLTIVKTVDVGTWIKPLRTCALALLAFVCICAPVSAHVLNITRVNVELDSSQTFKVRLAIDLTNAMGTSEAYYQLSLLPVEQQEPKIHELTATLLNEIQFYFGDDRATPELIAWKVPTASREVYLDYYVGKMTEFVFQGVVPPARAPFRLVTGEQGVVEYPLAYTLANAERGLRVTRFLEIATQPGERFDYDQSGGGKVARAPGTLPPPPTVEASPLSGLEYTATQRFWMVQGGTVWRYLTLGFHHIIPDGVDHILFVLGLFFFGLSWRKLLSQTTVFTVAHATTLYLSSKGIFSLPPWLVDPGIALSIAFIAFENVFRPKLGAGRLTVVFLFGLVHGLGFASGLKELSLPKREFLTGLLGFNFGVDFGQLFVILLAFLFVGWLREKTWYVPRVAVPASVLIGLVGAYWTVERIIFHVRVGG